MYAIGCYDDDMKTTYETVVLGFGNHASLEIPDTNLAEIGGNRRAPLKVTVNGHLYQSTATGVNGKCMVVFPMRDRSAAGVGAGDHVRVTLELDSGYRQVEIPEALRLALEANEALQLFNDLSYSQRKAFAQLVTEAKATETRERRIRKIISELRQDLATHP